MRHKGRTINVGFSPACRRHGPEAGCPSFAFAAANTARLGQNPDPRTKTPPAGCPTIRVPRPRDRMVGPCGRARVGTRSFRIGSHRLSCQGTPFRFAEDWFRLVGRTFRCDIKATESMWALAPEAGCHSFVFAAANTVRLGQNPDPRTKTPPAGCPTIRVPRPRDRMVGSCSRARMRTVAFSATRRPSLACPQPTRRTASHSPLLPVLYRVHLGTLSSNVYS